MDNAMVEKSITDIIKNEANSIKSKIESLLQNDELCDFLENDLGEVRPARSDISFSFVHEILEKYLKKGSRIEEFFAEIKTKNNLSISGFTALSKINENVDKYCSKDFLLWALETTKNHAYELHNEDLDKVLISYFDSKKFDIENFQIIVDTIKYNSSKYAILTYLKLTEKILDLYKSDRKEKKGIFQKESEWKEIETAKSRKLQQKFDIILKSITEMVNAQRTNNLYTFYFELNHKELSEIITIIRSSEEAFDLPHSDLETEPLLVSLLSYFIAVARKLNSENVSINDISSQWKLDSIFQTVGKLTSNEEIKIKIISEYKPEDDFYPLPLDLISDTLFSIESNASDGFKMTIVDSLRDRYSHTSTAEKNTIRDINKRIVLEPSIPSEIRDKAYHWVIDAVIENPEEKLKWGYEVLQKLGSAPSNIDIGRKCVDIIIDEKNSPSWREIRNGFIDVINEGVPSELRRYALERLC